MRSALVSFLSSSSDTFPLWSLLAIQASNFKRSAATHEIPFSTLDGGRFIEIDFCCSPRRKRCSKNRRIIRWPIANCGSPNGRMGKHRCVTFGSLCTSEPNGTRRVPSPLRGKSTIASSAQLARCAALLGQHPGRPRLLLLSRNSTSACHSSEERREFENALKQCH